MKQQTKVYSTEYSYTVDGDFSGTAGDFLRLRHNYSTRVINALKKNGRLLLNNEDIPFVQRVVPKDEIKVFFPVEYPDCEEFDIPIEIIYEDEDILIVNKPSGLCVHPTKSHQNDTLSGAVYSHWKTTGFIGKARYVNRLDMDTTGIVVIAKNKYIHHCLQDESLKGLTEKNYIAIVKGVPKAHSGIIDEPIERIDPDSFVRSVSEDGKACVTEYNLMQEFSDSAVLRLKLHSGRTHQIRVHLNYIGCPVMGDSLYNGFSPLISRQALHAHSYGFIHPRTKTKVVFTAELPQDMKNVIKTLEKSDE